MTGAATTTYKVVRRHGGVVWGGGGRNGGGASVQAWIRRCRGCDDGCIQNRQRRERSIVEVIAQKWLGKLNIGGWVGHGHRIYFTASHICPKFLPFVGKI